MHVFVVSLQRMFVTVVDKSDKESRFCSGYFNPEKVLCSVRSLRITQLIETIIFVILVQVIY